MQPMDGGRQSGSEQFARTQGLPLTIHTHPRAQPLVFLQRPTLPSPLPHVVRSVTEDLAEMRCYNIAFKDALADQMLERCGPAVWAAGMLAAAGAIGALRALASVVLLGQRGRPILGGWRCCQRRSKSPMPMPFRRFSPTLHCTRGDFAQPSCRPRPLSMHALYPLGAAGWASLTGTCWARRCARLGRSTITTTTSSRVGAGAEGPEGSRGPVGQWVLGGDWGLLGGRSAGGRLVGECPAG